MKNISFLFWCAAAGLFLTSCRDEDRIRIPESANGVNMRIVIDPAHSVINYATAATDIFAFDAYSQNDDLHLVEFLATYNGETKVVASFSQSDFSDDGKVRVELDAEDFATLFGVPGFTNGTSGGNFTIRPSVTLNDGRTYPDYVHVSSTDSIYNLAGSITAAPNGAFTLQVITSITCPPLDLSGEYIVVSAIGTSTDNCCPGETSVSGNTVIVTADHTTVFTVSDITGGLYFEWYDVFGITSPDDTPGKLGYNCQEVNIINSPEPFETFFTGGGTYNPTTGTIRYYFLNGYGDRGVVTLQRI